MALPNTAQLTSAVRTAITKAVPFYTKQVKKVMALLYKTNFLIPKLPADLPFHHNHHMFRVQFDPHSQQFQQTQHHRLCPCGERIARTRLRIAPTIWTRLLYRQVPAGQTRIRQHRQRKFADLAKLEADHQRVRKSQMLHHLRGKEMKLQDQKALLLPKRQRFLVLQVQRNLNHWWKHSILDHPHLEGQVPGLPLPQTLYSISSSPTLILPAFVFLSMKRLLQTTS